MRHIRRCVQCGLSGQKKMILSYHMDVNVIEDMKENTSVNADLNGKVGYKFKYTPFCICGKPLDHIEDCFDRYFMRCIMSDLLRKRRLIETNKE